MKTTTVKGTNDYLPEEMLLRDYLQNTILGVYRAAGFSRISTPAIEDAENLDKSEGGENLNLIFKILKRGDKFTEAIEAQDYKNLSDLGLRYDLTLPLCRYYSNNKAKLMLPMKCIQIDRVWRAERPQKGRLREFQQCDIDILGSDSPDCEIELIETTAKALLAIGIDNFTVKVNDRRILWSLLVSCGFKEEAFDSTCITIDKLDKIGSDGVRAELEGKGADASAIDKLMDFLSAGEFTLEKVEEMTGDKESASRLRYIIGSAETLANGKYGVVYDPTLIRGQGYYTGTVFEIASADFRGSVAGGGRYDKLIGKFIGESVPAVGFSIGFERIFSILTEKGYKIPNARRRIAVIYEDGNAMEAIRTAEEFRTECDVSLFEKPKKLGKLLSKLEAAGFNGFHVLGETEKGEIRPLG
ncbi:MAG: histidine--tRNA ligase [Clostridia bacterium]|nr:histidine--tRNA ligase [Clostridia bacterium]